VGPGGQNIMLMSDTGGFSPVSGINLTIDDAAAGTIPNGSLTRGTYKPTNISEPNDPPTGNLPSPPPTVSANTTLAAAFNGTDPNGTWKLYVADDASAESGSISGGWSITITTASAAATTTTVTSSPNPSFTTAPNNSVTFTATVTSSGN